MVGLLVLAGLVVVAVVVWRLKKANKPVTAATVVAAVEADAKADASKAAAAVANTVTKAV